ncbi:MAG: hypothetical protein WD061_00025 [Candidatus Saccharimonadales bacterium]
MNKPLKQSNQPLFEDILWNQPVSRAISGNLLIIGGHSEEFKLTQSIFMQASKNCQTKVILPDRIRRLIGPVDNGIYVASTPSGSIARNAQEEILAAINDSDCLLLSADLSQNSETVGLIETILHESEKPVIITEEILLSLFHNLEAISKSALIISSPNGLSELANKLHVPIYVKTPDLQKELKLLEALSEKLDMPLVSISDNIVISYQDQISITPNKQVDLSKLIADISVFYMQHENKFKAVTTAVFQDS